jgi:hypothetical protein
LPAASPVKTMPGAVPPRKPAKAADLAAASGATSGCQSQPRTSKVSAEFDTARWMGCELPRGLNSCRLSCWPAAGKRGEHAVVVACVLSLSSTSSLSDAGEPASCSLQCCTDIEPWSGRGYFDMMHRCLQDTVAMHHIAHLDCGADNATMGLAVKVADNTPCNAMQQMQR